VFSVKRKYALIAAVAFVLGLAAFALVRNRYSTPAFRVTPLTEWAGTLSTADVQRIVQGDFRIVRRVQQIPTAVRQGFTLLSHDQFSMANPGHEMSTDMILPGVPNKRLVFAGIGTDTAVLVFEQGGFVGKVHATVLAYSPRGGTWGAMLDDYNVTDLHTLRAVIEKGRYKTWESMR
jgi:hypothetical protein